MAEISILDDLVTLLLDYGVLQFGRFCLKSGRESPYFLNFGAVNSGRALRRLAELYRQQVFNHFGGGPMTFFGPAYKGIPLAASVAMVWSETFGSEAKFIYNRKEAKIHGETGVFVGDLTYISGTVVVIEDVLTAGTTLDEVVPELRSLLPDAPAAAIVAIDREESVTASGETARRHVERKLQLPILSLATVSAVMQAIADRPDREKYGATDERLKEVQLHLEKYGGRP